MYINTYYQKWVKPGNQNFKISINIVADNFSAKTTPINLSKILIT